VKNGSERSIEEGRDHMRTLRRMQEYSSYDSTGDKGQGVREKSKQLIDLLGSNDQIREEREKAKRLRGKFGGVGSDGGYGGGGGGGSRYDSGGGPRNIKSKSSGSSNDIASKTRTNSSIKTESSSNTMVSAAVSFRARPAASKCANVKLVIS
jgi:epsin